VKSYCLCDQRVCYVCLAGYVLQSQDIIGRDCHFTSSLLYQSSFELSNGIATWHLFCSGNTVDSFFEGRYFQEFRVVLKNKNHELCGENSGALASITRSKRLVKGHSK